MDDPRRHRESFREALRSDYDVDATRIFEIASSKPCSRSEAPLTRRFWHIPPCMEFDRVCAITRMPSRPSHFFIPASLERLGSP